MNQILMEIAKNYELGAIAFAAKKVVKQFNPKNEKKKKKKKNHWRLRNPLPKI